MCSRIASLSGIARYLQEVNAPYVEIQLLILL
jgi:hypothetical protein